MKVVLFSPIIYPWRVDLYSVFAKKVEKVILYTTGIYGNYPNWKELERKVCTITYLKFFGDRLVHPKLFANIFLDSPDLIIISSTESISSMLLYSMAKIRKIPIILIAEKNIDTFSNFFYIRFLSRIKKYVVKLIHKDADVIVAESDASKDYLINMGCNQNKIHVHPHGVDINRFKPAPLTFDFAKSMGISKEDLSKTTVLYLGGFYLHKGIDYLLKAIGGETLKNIVFLIPKYGPLFSSYEYTLQKHKNIKILPLINPADMIDLYSISDIVIVPSITYTGGAECSPNVLMEAMACGKAIIATNIGGIPSILSDCGLLIPEKDSDAIRESILKLASDNELIEKYGELARRRAVQVLSMDKYVDFILHLYYLYYGSKKHGAFKK